MLHFLGPALLGINALSCCVPQPILPLSTFLVALQYGKDKSDIFNILWALVFGFATLNILGLVARRFEPERNRLSFGETLAVMVVLVSVVLLGWEMLTLFKVFPIKLHPR
jgi:hypothetical protein